MGILGIAYVIAQWIGFGLVLVIAIGCVATAWHLLK